MDKIPANKKTTVRNKTGTGNGTRRTRPEITASNIAKWKIFDAETGKNAPIDAVHRKCGLREFCDTCSTILAYSDDGYLTCTNPECCIMYKDIVDQSPEWRYYGNDDGQTNDPTRCGMPINPLLEESSFGCKVALNFGGRIPHYMYRIKRYTEYQTIPHKEKTQFNEFQIITIMSQNAGIPKLFIDDALWFHKKISGTNHSFRGDNKDGIIAASIYMACRKNKSPRTAREIATIFHLDPTSATHGCKTAQFILNDIEQNMDDADKTVFSVPKPRDFVERYCTRLHLNAELTKLCEFIAIKIDNMDFMTDNTPNSIAAGIIHFISQECVLGVGKKEISDISDISEVTINKCCKRIEAIKADILPKSIVVKYNIVM